MKIGIIYKVESPEGMVYIGKTMKVLDNRRYFHEAAASNENDPVYHTHFSHAIRKWGDQLKWEVYHGDVLVEELDELEIKTIEEFNSYRNGYNSTEGGTGGDTFSGRSKASQEQTRKKLSRALKGKPKSEKHKAKLTRASRAKAKAHSKLMSGTGNPMFGRTHSEEAKAKIREAWKRRKRK